MVSPKGVATAVSSPSGVASPLSSEPTGPSLGVSKGLDDAVPPFTVGAASLQRLYEPGSDAANGAALAALGGARALCAALSSDAASGVDGSAASLAARRSAFGSNVLPGAKRESWWKLFFATFRDEVIIILIVAAVISIIIGSIPDVAEDPSSGWIDGLAILLAVAIVACVTATNDYRKSAQFAALADAAADKRLVGALRGGARVHVRVGDVVVGDVLHLECGATVPADGVLLGASDLRVDESSLTGESEDVRKAPATVGPPAAGVGLGGGGVRGATLGATHSAAHGSAHMLLAGTQLSAGTCDVLVTAVGVRCVAGRALSGLPGLGSEETPLQEKLDKLAQRIGYVGMAAALGTFAALMSIKALGHTELPWGQWAVKSFI